MNNLILSRNLYPQPVEIVREKLQTKIGNDVEAVHQKCDHYLIISSSGDLPLPQVSSSLTNFETKPLF